MCSGLEHFSKTSLPPCPSPPPQTLDGAGSEAESPAWPRLAQELRTSEPEPESEVGVGRGPRPSGYAPAHSVLRVSAFPAPGPGLLVWTCRGRDGTVRWEPAWVGSLFPPR